jgi:hypothetical protein
VPARHPGGPVPLIPSPREPHFVGWPHSPRGHRFVSCTAAALPAPLDERRRALPATRDKQEVEEGAPPRSLRERQRGPMAGSRRRSAVPAVRPHGCRRTRGAPKAAALPDTTTSPAHTLRVALAGVRGQSPHLTPDPSPKPAGRTGCPVRPRGSWSAEVAALEESVRAARAHGAAEWLAGRRYCRACGEPLPVSLAARRCS